MRNLRALRYSLILAMLLPLAACDDEVAGPNDGTASLSVYLTDGPGNADKVWVQLLSVTAVGGEGGPVELLTAPTELILLTDLVGTVYLLNTDVALDLTKTNQIRLVVGDAVLLDTDDKIYVKSESETPSIPPELEGKEQGDLQCPSCSQSGIKVKVPNDEIDGEGGEAALVLDFDVSQSFGHRAGNSGKWVMHPVIHGTLVADDNGENGVLDELGLVGAITGTVTWGSTPPVCPTDGAPSGTDFVPTATVIGHTDGDGQPIVKSGTVVEESGTFTYTIGFLPAASYEMGFVETVEFTNDRVTFTATPTLTPAPVSGSDPVVVDYTINATCAAK